MIGYWLVLVATIHTIAHFLSCPWTWATSTLLISFPRQPLRVNSPNSPLLNGAWAVALGPRRRLLLACILGVVLVWITGDLFTFPFSGYGGFPIRYLTPDPNHWSPAGPASLFRPEFFVLGFLFWTALAMIPVLIIDRAWVLKFESQEYPDSYFEEPAE
jgi:hypothetical protein